MKLIWLKGLFALISLISCTEKNGPCQQKTWYADSDADGKGDPARSKQACEQPIGYVDNADDDNDDPNAGKSIIPENGYSTPLSYENLKLVWQDEFDGEALNETFWNYETGNNGGWGNNELEYYTKENTELKDGHLIITAKKESKGGFNYTSSRLTTQDKFSFTYGRVDIRAALPKGQGIWPALWMLGQNFKTAGWPKCGEIDIMEMIGGNQNGRDNTVYGTVHWDNAGNYAQYGGHYEKQSGPLNGEFHVFSIVWDAEKIVWYIDDKQYHIIDITPKELDEFQKDFFLLVNLAVGGNWPGNPDGSTLFPQYLIVDYIRVFQ